MTHHSQIYPRRTSSLIAAISDRAAPLLTARWARVESGNQFTGSCVWCTKSTWEHGILRSYDPEAIAVT